MAHKPSLMELNKEEESFTVFPHSNVILLLLIVLISLFNFFQIQENEKVIQETVKLSGENVLNYGNEKALSSYLFSVYKSDYSNDIIYSPTSGVIYYQKEGKWFAIKCHFDFNTSIKCCTEGELSTPVQFEDGNIIDCGYEWKNITFSHCLSPAKPILIKID